MPEPLELVARWATVDPDDETSGDRRDQITLGANWFFSGHRNKLTIDVSRIRFLTSEGGRDSEHLRRVQWDVSF